MGGWESVHRGGEVGEQGINRSRWRTDGPDYRSILGDGGREAGRTSEGEINSERERESEDVVRVENRLRLGSGRGGGRKSIDMLLWCL